jgi:transcriptional regulator with XRE-family HTH domain
MLTIGKRIAAARKRAGFANQAELARRLGISRQAVNAWEKDHSEPSANLLGKIAMLTNTSYDFIATGRGSHHPTGEIDMLLLQQENALLRLALEDCVAFMQGKISGQEQWGLVLRHAQSALGEKNDPHQILIANSSGAPPVKE